MSADSIEEARAEVFARPGLNEDEYLSEATATLADGTTVDLLRENEEGNVDTTPKEAQEQPSRQRSFGSLSPQEAGRRSAALRKERDRAQQLAAEAASDGRVLMLRTPVHLGDIVASLADRAKKGDTAAARELREWMREYPADDQTDIASLDARTQREVFNRILAEIIADEGGLPAEPLPSA